MNPVQGILFVIVTIFIPPVGVFMIAGCGMDLFINICLTVLGYFPGHIHAFYLGFIYFDRQEKGRRGTIGQSRAPGIYSEHVQSGGRSGYEAIDQV